MNLPKISIITITYNSDKTLEETIKSVINQNYPNLEYIIIDGASSDNTLSIVEKYKEHISTIVSEPDNGISDAFNKGINRATGDIIGLINSDDKLLPGSLKVLADNYSEGIDVYRGNLLVWDDQNDKHFRAVPSMKFPLYKRLSTNICHQSTFITKNAYTKWGLYKLNYNYMMDADLLIRFYQKGAIMKYINEDFAVFRLGGVTNSAPSKKTKELESMIISNNGNRFLAKLIVFSFYLYQYSKRVLFNIFGENLIRKIKY